MSLKSFSYEMSLTTPTFSQIILLHEPIIYCQQAFNLLILPTALLITLTLKRETLGTIFWAPNYNIPLHNLYVYVLCFALAV